MGRESRGMTGYPTPKLALDKVVSVALLLLLAPVFAVVLVAILVDRLCRRTDRGPFLYREPRIARGRRFDLLKFRTLRREVLERVADQESHVRLLEADFGNLTWAGRHVLKPWYLDELPQLWNVLRGDMSLVGPRPWPPSMVASQVAQGYTYRNEFIAGWTGPSQVTKGVAEPAEYAVLDLEYVDGCRRGGALTIVRRDLALLYRTVLVIARGEGLRF
jgi:lipopolysaccharide/colanic/teichoic acid biosynthesis glycosyltransferase